MVLMLIIRDFSSANDGDLKPQEANAVVCQGDNGIFAMHGMINLSESRGPILSLVLYCGWAVAKSEIHQLNPMKFDRCVDR